MYKPVFTKDGEKIGRVSQIIFTHEEIQGVVVAKGLFFGKTFVDIEYIDKFTPNSVLLKINPITLLIKRKVFDSEGRDIGVVKRIKRKSHSNELQAIYVKKGIFSKEIEVPVKDITIHKKSIRLKIAI
ncbi:hypothetical protein BVX95_00610 [archaeon D22]|nr:hypothetical protein BVX95_00610 [archaeon D22]